MGNGSGSHSWQISLRRHVGLMTSSTGNYIRVPCDDPRNTGADRCSFDDTGLSCYVGVVGWAQSMVLSGLISQPFR